jgi:hypothetical protein
MNDLSAKEKDIVHKEFLRAKNLFIIKKQEEEKLRKDKELAEAKAKKIEQRKEV